MITVTPQPDIGGLQLAISTVATINNISRSDANGVADVRTLPGVLPWTAPRVEVKRNKATNAWPSTDTGWGSSSGYVRTKDFLFGRTVMLYTKTGTGNFVTYGRRAGMTGSGSSSTAPTNATEVATVAPGESVTCSLGIGTDTANTTGNITIRFFKADFSDAGGATSSAAVDMLLNTHQTMTVTATAPALAAYYWLEWNVALKNAGNTVGGEKAWASRALLGPTGAYFDGGTVETDTLAYTYAGTAQASDSIAWGPATDLILTDFEAASGAVSYSTTSTAGAIVTTSATWALPGPWLFVPVMPSYSVQLKTLLEYGAGGNSLGTVHELMGRDDPVAILRGMSTRRGTLRLYCGTFAEAMAVVTATRRGEVLMLRQPEHQGMDMYFTATSYGIPTLDTNGGKSIFGVDLGYIELARPDGDLSGSLGWTFAALASSQTSFKKLPSVYATFQDMLLNRKKP